MSKGPGCVELAITELLATAKPLTSFTVAQICTSVFGSTTPTQPQRGSVLRAAYRALRRNQGRSDRRQAAWVEAWDATAAKLGYVPEVFDRTFAHALKKHPAMQVYKRMPVGRLDGWQAMKRLDGLVVFCR